MALGFGLLGTLVLSTNCYAGPRGQEASAVSEKDTNGSASSDGKAGKPETSVQPAAPWEERENSVGLHLLKNIAEDHKALWVGPKSLRWVDTEWLVPLGGAAAAMFATDTEYSRHISNSPNRIKYSKDLSNYGLASMVGIGGGLYVLGHVTHDDHKIETGILAGEAAIDSLAPVYGMKYAFGRERPLQDNYQGRFGQGGVSFPSEHAAAAWSIASVIAHEYPGPLTSLLVYGLASAVSASRITGKQHFPSDVLVGSAIGWLEGMYVYRSTTTRGSAAANGKPTRSRKRAASAAPATSALRMCRWIVGSIQRWSDLRGLVYSTTSSWGCGHGREVNARGL